VNESARDAAANERPALKAGAFAYLEKPVDDEDLLEAIATALK
jgi:FixJ family two-component response regulator